MSSTPIPFQLEKDAEPIPGYILQEPIGVGGCGEVWKASAPGGLTKAIKFVHGSTEEDSAERELKSLELVKQLSHPFLLNLERIEIIKGHLIIVSEIADSNLKERFATYKRAGVVGIPREELINYLGEAAEALDYLQEGYSLQHLDVKPENILLVGKHVKLADFGLVRDLNDISSSIGTGMTPKYAPPELLDCQPSPYSDQYSLAIVYCEMVTGQAPFSGHTPAILASQHLHSAPNLELLTAADRGTIEKALSKEPDRRFDSCSELIARLRRRDTASVLIGVAESPSIPRATSYSPSPSSSPTQTGSLSRPDDAGTGGKHDGCTLTYSSLATRSLPPLEPGSKSVRHRPAVLVGIGGTGGRVLRHLKQLLSDRFGDDPVLPSLQFLFIDTDARAIRAATTECEYAPLRSEETLFLPLQSGWEYRNMPLGELSSISRRWLYIIPRSRQTEGIRAFGRIALLDHMKTVLHNLRAAISYATSAEAAKITTERTGLPFRDSDPRVFLVASIGGGTGSGMLIDISYSIRQLLTEAGLSDDDVCGLLTYTTARGKRSPCLETGNAYACLEELRYFCSAENDYPGERACGISGFREDRAALPHTYVVEMDGLGAEDVYEEQIDRLARYLFLSTVSPASAFFDTCRGLGRKQQDSGQLCLRTLSVLPVAVDCNKIKPEWITTLCRSLIAKWRGNASRAAPCSSLMKADGRRQFRLPDSPTETSHAGQKHKNESSPFDELATRHIRSLRIDSEQITSRIRTDVSSKLGRNVAEYVHEVIARVESECRTHGARTKLNPSAIITKVNSLLSVQDAPQAVDASATDSLQDIAAKEAGRIANACEQLMVNGLFELAEEGSEGIGGAVTVAEGIIRLIEGTRDDVSQLLGDVQVKRKELAAELASKRYRQRINRRLDCDSFLSRLGEYGDLLLEEIIYEAGCKTIDQLNSSGRRCLGKLHELCRIVDHIGEEFCDSLDTDNLSGEAELETDNTPLCGASAARVFTNHQEEMTEQLDCEIRSSFFTAQRRITDLLTADNTVRRELADYMRVAARRVIIRSLETIALSQVGTVLKEADNSRVASQLEHLLKAIRPGILKMGGGARRLLLLGPDDVALEMLHEKVERLAGERITVVNTSQREILLCCEAEEFGFESVAASLMTSQPDCKEMSSRLRTRVDVAW